MPTASSSPAPPGELGSLIKQLEQNIASSNLKTSTSVLSKAKIALLHHKALVPTAGASPDLLRAAQYVLELGALISIRLQDTTAFTRYFQQLQPFYASAALLKTPNQRSKITGLYLLLLLSQGDYAGFHTLLEGLEVAAPSAESSIDEDENIQYPIRLQQWLMEGSYDRVWEATQSERVPSEEFAIFSNVLIGTIRDEVASCSEKAYPSIPVTNAKNLLFLDSEGSVVGFSKDRGWQAQDGRIYFPPPDADVRDDNVLASSGQVIENTLGYARELETIV